MKSKIIIITVITSLIAYYSCQQKDNDLLNANVLDVKSELNILKLGVENEFYYSKNGKKELFTIRKDKVIIKTNSADDAKTLTKHEIFSYALAVGHVWVLATADPLKTNLNTIPCWQALQKTVAKSKLNVEF